MYQMRQYISKDCWEDELNSWAWHTLARCVAHSAVCRMLASVFLCTSMPVSMFTSIHVMSTGRPISSPCGTEIKMTTSEITHASILFLFSIFLHSSYHQLALLFLFPPPSPFSPSAATHTFLSPWVRIQVPWELQLCCIHASTPRISISAWHIIGAQ